MALSAWVAFAQFLKEHNYTTRMWEHGYGAAEANEVCHHLTEWAHQVLELDGEFLVLWSDLQDTEFSGDNELIFLLHEKAYLIPNPFLEGETEGFLTALQNILQRPDELFEVSVRRRILYNAV